MIPTRGLGRGGVGALVMAGLGRRNDFIGAGGGFWSSGSVRKRPRGSAEKDERDLAEILPAIIGALNAH